MSRPNPGGQDNWPCYFFTAPNRIARAAAGNFGDVKAVGDSVFEMRIFVGKGYHIYFCMQGSEVVILLCGGNKSSQQKDIENARVLAKEL
jgi:putative addiction module killer protein